MPELLTIQRLDAAATQAALPDLVRLLQDVVEGGASIGFLPPLNTAEAEAYWQSVADALHTPHRILLAARHDGTLAGSVQLGLESRANGNHRAEVMKLMVHRAHRRSGIARRLMAALEEEARRAGRTTLVLDTRAGDPSETLYTTLGYTCAGAIPNYARSADGSLHTTVFMYKLLKEGRMTDPKLDGFLGVWELDPSQSAYELGEPPARGRYAIAFDGTYLHFDIDWTTAKGQEMATTVDALPDGHDHPYADNPTFADTINYTVVDTHMLDSTAKLRGKVTGYARRVLAPDGQSMTITQSGTGPDGRGFANVSVYRRVEA